jgi:hypothetical protein
VGLTGLKGPEVEPAIGLATRPQGPSSSSESSSNLNSSSSSPPSSSSNLFFSVDALKRLGAAD